MNNLNNFFKKFVAIIVLSSLIFSFSLIAEKPKKAEAGFFDIVFDPTLTAKEVAIDIANRLLDALRDAVVKRLVDMMTDQIVTWIQGDGEPRFVEDFGQFAKDAFSAGAGDVIYNSENFRFLCAPFSLQVKLSFPSSPRFSESVKCTLDQIAGNVENFYRNFESGGWLAYSQSWQPQNNYLGVMLMIEDEALRRGFERQNAALNEVISGKGFLSVKRCLEYDESPDSAYNACLNYGGDPEGCKNARKCIKEKIETPGETVGEAVSQAIGAQKDWVVNVKSVVSVIVNAVIQRLINEGLSLMTGSGSGSGGNDITAPEFQGAVDQQVNFQKQAIIGEYEKFLNYWQSILLAKRETFSYLGQTLTAYQQINAQNCQPPVSDADISVVIADISRLNSEIEVLDGIVSQVQALIDEVKNTPNSQWAVSGGVLVAAYEQFTKQFGYLYDDIINGTSVNAAGQETEMKRQQLLNAQNKLAACTQSQ